MTKISTAYHTRASRVMAIAQALKAEEARIAERGVREAVQIQLYDRTPLMTSGRMLDSVQVQMYAESFAIVFSVAVAPHANRRLGMTGISPSGGHVLDMDPQGYMIQKYGPQISALHLRYNQLIGGVGVTCYNGN